MEDEREQAMEGEMKEAMEGNDDDTPVVCDIGVEQEPKEVTGDGDSVGEDTGQGKKECAAADSERLAVSRPD